MTSVIRNIAIIMGMILSVAVFAIQKPSVFVNQLVNSVKHEVSTKHLSLKKNPKLMYALVSKTVMPKVDLEQMAGMTIGPRWRAATDAQKAEFVSEFSKLLTRNYSAALLAVGSYDYTIYPLRKGVWKGQSSVAVHGSIASKRGGKGSSVTYYLKRSGDHWKVYDFSLEGVSFVNNFRSQFASFEDMNSLIKALKKLNLREKS